MPRALRSLIKKSEPVSYTHLGGDTFNSSERDLTLLLSEKLEAFFKKLGLKTSLAELGIGSEHFEEMADRATKNGAQTVGHYIPLDKQRFIDILKLA